MNINVPEKFGVCGFNDIEMAAYAEPALSSVSVNRYSMGSKAIEIIFQKINQALNQQANQQIKQDDKVLAFSNYIDTGFELVMRKSTR